MSQFGDFHDFCRDSTLPVCNLFLRLSGSQYDDGGINKECVLLGYNTKSGRIRNLGSIIVCAIAIAIAGLLMWLSERKRAAVGRREIQVLLGVYAIVCVAEIFSVGGFLTNRTALIWFSAIHIGAVTAACWTLLVNAVVGYQLIDDGTALSIGLTVGSALAVFVTVGYVAADTGFNHTGRFKIEDPETLRNYALYVLYLLFPLIFIVAFFILESVLVVGVLRERRPMVLLTIAAIFFAISQVFNFVISVHVCKATDGKIDGAVFETLFVLLAVVALWFFWSSITEDEWPEEGDLAGTEVQGYA